MKMELSKAIEKYNELIDDYFGQHYIAEDSREVLYKRITLLKGYIDTMNISNIADYVLDISTGIEDLNGNLTLIENNIEKIQIELD
jgi:hypothetical protein